MRSVRDRSDRGVLAVRHRRALTRTAVNAAAAGLPVVPGAWWNASARRFECDQAGCTRTGPHPAVAQHGSFASGPTGLASLTAQAVRHPDAVAQRWQRAPYAVLVLTGETCDVVDVPGEVGRQLAMRLGARSVLGPVIAIGSRWLFLTAPGSRLPALGTGVLVHGHGSWVMLPPSRGAGGEPAGWLARPRRGGGWLLPRRDDVIHALDVLTLTGRKVAALLASV